MRFEYPRPGNEDEFEDFCLRYYRHLLKRQTLIRYGKRGERQDGIDLIDQCAMTPLPAIQCKRHEPIKSIEPAEIRLEVKKAESSHHAIDQYIIATTARRSRNAHDVVIALNGRSANEKKFTVEIHFWEDICERLCEFGRAVADFIVYGESASERDQDQIVVQSDTFVYGVGANTELGDCDIYPEIIELLKQRKLEAAQYAISKLPDPTTDSSLTAKRKYAILRLRGKLALEQLQFDEAVRLFLLAFEAQPDLEQAKLNRILALEFSNQHDAAYAEAVSIINDGHKSATLLSLLVRNAKSSEEFEHYQNEIDEFNSDESLNMALAQRYVAFGQVKKAAEAADRALVAAPNSAHAQLTSAMIAHHVGMQGSWKQRSKNLASALSHYTIALESAVRDKYPGIIPEILTNRARVNAFLGNTQDAANDYREAVRRSDRPALYGIDAVSFFLSVEDFEAAAEIAPLLDSENAESQYLQLVVKYSRAAPAGKRDCILAMAALSELGSDRATEARFQCVQWAIQLHDWDLAKSLVTDSFMSTLPFQANILLSWVHLESGDNDKALAFANVASESSAVAAHKQEIAMLGTLFARLGDDEKALPLLEQSITTGILDANCKKLIECAKRLERHDTLLRVCAELRATGSPDGIIRKLEVQLLSRYLPEKAFTLANEFKPFDERYFTAVSNFLAVRLKRPHKIILDTAKLPSPGALDPPESYLVVDPYIETKHFADAIDFLYQQLRKYFSSETAHRQYFSFVLSYGKQSSLLDTPSQIDGQCAVQLENTLTGERRWVVIEDDSPDALRDEFAISSPIALALVGRRKGDFVDVPGRLMQPQREVVVDIQTKYLRLFQSSINNFQHRFPSAVSLQTVHVGSGDAFNPSALIETLQARGKFVEDLVTFYKKSLCSIHMLSARLGVSELRAIEGLIADDSSLLRCSDCSADVFAELAASGIDSPRIVLDITAIATISQLDAWDLLDPSKEYVISRTTSNIVSYWVRELSENISQATAHAFVTEDGRLVMREVQPEEVESQRLKITAIEKHMADICTPVSSVAMSALDPKRREMYINAVGFHTLEAMSIAKDERAPLWTDDLFVGCAAVADFGVRRVWTQLVFLNLQERQIIDHETYNAVSVGHSPLAIEAVR